MTLLTVVTFLSLLQGTERPELVRGRIETLGAPTDLGKALEALGGTGENPVWIGYAVPMVAGSHHLCGASVVRLGGDRHTDSWDGGGDATTLFVMQRVVGGRVGAIAVSTPGCRVEPENGTLYWWEPVAPSRSLEHLAGLAKSSDEVGREALRAIALHAGPEAGEILARFAAASPSRDVREKAIFWLGAVARPSSLAKLGALVVSESDPELREKIVFALHLLKEDGAIEKLVDVARSDPEAEVRERALFWLAQRAGKKAASAIASAVRTDPEIEVKKKAVFALSQLPADEGVPLLIEVAETHGQPEVRKAAFFWLGQSKDPRAVALFERVLLGSR